MRSAPEIAKDFTELVMASIRLEDANPMKPKRQDLLTLSVRMPASEKHRFERLARDFRVEQTQIVRKALMAILDQLEAQQRQVQQMAQGHIQAPLFSDPAVEQRREARS